jgi:hypothetical protein
MDKYATFEDAIDAVISENMLKVGPEPMIRFMMVQLDTNKMYNLTINEDNMVVVTEVM